LGDRRLQFAEDVRSGLQTVPKKLPSVYFYDELGSQLFEKICDLKEYYLTRAETDILLNHARTIVSRLDQRAELVELGSGSSRKTRLLLEAFIHEHGKAHYCPIDVSAEILETSAQQLLAVFNELQVTAVADRYESGLERLELDHTQPKMVMWLGSSIGNFTRGEATEFLRHIRLLLTDDDCMLIGIDLRKPSSILVPAYNDDQNITAAFNLNVLTRINDELGGDFDLDLFRHEALYDEEEGRIEMYLQSRVQQEVFVEDLGISIPFTKDEAVLTEYSYKYSPEEITSLAVNSGFELSDQWFDEGVRFSLNLFEPI